MALDSFKENEVRLAYSTKLPKLIPSGVAHGPSPACKASTDNQNAPSHAPVLAKHATPAQLIQWESEINPRRLSKQMADLNQSLLLAPVRVANPHRPRRFSWTLDDCVQHYWNECEK